MLIITGIIVHIKNLWQEFCKIRSDASMLRFVLDIHNGIGVLFLPFISIMTLSGFLFFAPLYISFISKPEPHYQSKIDKSIILNSAEPDKVLDSLLHVAQKTFFNPAGFIL